MTEKLHTFTSGATSGELKPRYNLPTGFGERVTALRFGYGNEKHENGTYVLAEANWLKAFHARDLAFFQDRMNHAREHLRAESQGNFDKGPGGNWGAVGWCVDIMPFVAEYDPEFYRAVVGLAPHPGKREKDCICSRCAAGVTGEAQPPAGWVSVPKGLKILDVKPAHFKRCEKCNQTYLPGLRFCCNRCEECCTCL